MPQRAFAAVAGHAIAVYDLGFRCICCHHVGPLAYSRLEANCADYGSTTAQPQGCVAHLCGEYPLKWSVGKEVGCRGNIAGLILGHRQEPLDWREEIVEFVFFADIEVVVEALIPDRIAFIVNPSPDRR